jgi:hypothetical protein
VKRVPFLPAWSRLRELVGIRLGSRDSQPRHEQELRPWSVATDPHIIGLPTATCGRKGASMLDRFFPDGRVIERLRRSDLGRQFALLGTSLRR